FACRALSSAYGPGAPAPAPPFGSRLWPACACRRARRAQPDPPDQPRAARRDAELLGLRLLPDPARRGQGRDRAAARPPCLARRAGAFGRAGGTAPHRQASAPAPPAADAVDAALPRLLRADVGDLPRPERHRGRRGRPVAAARAVAALVRAAGIRGVERPVRARVERGPKLARRLRGVRRGERRPRTLP